MNKEINLNILIGERKNSWYINCREKVTLSFHVEMCNLIWFKLKKWLVNEIFL